MLEAPTRTSTSAFAIFFTNVIVGDLEITVDWTQPTNTMWVLVSQGTCSIDQLVQTGCPDGPSCACPFIVRSLESTPKPRVFRVSSAAAGSRTLIVWNQGPGSETASFNVTLIN